MKTIKIDIKVGFTTDACLKLYFRRKGELIYAEAWSEKTVGVYNHYNDKYQMNLNPCEHHFSVNINNDDIVDYENSYVEFGFTGARDRWVGPGIIRRIPLGELIPEDKK